MAFARTPVHSSTPCRPGGGGRGARPPTTRATAEAGATSVGAGGEWADPRAGPRTKRPENAGGTFWVDSKCIDCDTCR